jgi:hypothetical protein
MMDNEFNPIKPVESLPNVAGVTPAGQRREQKRRQNPARPGREPQGTPPEAAAEKEPTDRADDSHTIDYCA